MGFNNTNCSLFALAHKSAIDHEGGQAAGHVAAGGHQDVSTHLHFNCTWASNICQTE